MKTPLNTAEIDKYIEREKITKNELCERCNISYETLQRMYKNKGKFRIETILRIVLVLKITMNHFLNLD